MNQKIKQASNESTTQQVGFDDIKAKPGDALQIQLPNDERRYPSRLIGYVFGKTILVQTPVVGNQVLMLRENQTLSVRAFSNTSAFAFSTQITKIASSPVPYLHLGWPRSVQKVAIRGAARIEFNLSATVTNHSVTPAAQHSVVIVDLSTTGAAFAADKPVGKKDDELTLQFNANLHGIDVSPALPCIVRAVTPSQTGPIKYGVQFKALPLLDTLTIQGLICGKVVRN